MKFLSLRSIYSFSIINDTKLWDYALPLPLSELFSKFIRCFVW